MKIIICERVSHDSGIRVALRFPYDKELINLVRTLPDARWSQRMGCWHLEDREDIINLLLKKFSKIAYIDYTALRKQNPEKEISRRREGRDYHAEKVIQRGNSQKSDLA